ncbi:UNVERIFIED_CONTAM: hypothetical protein K2H54_044571 [Gekko kuhli]
MWTGGLATSWYVDLHNLDAPELGSMDAFMWALRGQFEDRTAAEKAEAFLCTFKQGKMLIREYSMEFQRQAVRIRDWTDPVLAQQYRLGLPAEIRNNMMSSQNPRTLQAWMQEVERAESHLQVMCLDAAATAGRGLATPHPKAKAPPPKVSVWEQRMKQGLCLKCGERGHFTVNCHAGDGGGSGGKEGDKRWSDSTPKKGTVRVHNPRALQAEVEVLEPNSDEECKPAGKGQVLL